MEQDRRLRGRLWKLAASTGQKRAPGYGCRAPVSGVSRCGGYRRAHESRKLLLSGPLSELGCSPTCCRSWVQVTVDTFGTSVSYFCCHRQEVDWVFVDHPSYKRLGLYGDATGPFQDNQVRLELAFQAPASSNLIEWGSQSAKFGFLGRLALHLNFGYTGVLGLLSALGRLIVRFAAVAICAAVLSSSGSPFTAATQWQSLWY